MGDANGNVILREPPRRTRVVEEPGGDRRIYPVGGEMAGRVASAAIDPSGAARINATSGVEQRHHQDDIQLHVRC